MKFHPFDLIIWESIMPSQSDNMDLSPQEYDEMMEELRKERLKDKEIPKELESLIEDELPTRVSKVPKLEEES
jgi:hypothetical protein